MLYPLKFAPILKHKIWGGTKLESLFAKVSVSDKIGESWELSTVEDSVSTVVNGILAGNSLSELIEIYMGELVGDNVFDEFGHTFPLLLKLIDANENLSIQVHPGNEMAAQRHNSYGKTEMWYVLDAEPQGELIIGFARDCAPDLYMDAIQKGCVENLLQKVPVSKGDVFFIPAGMIHAIGKGVVVAEIQQSSDVTYRIFDYKRTDDTGLERELHIEQSLDVINFQMSKSPKITYETRINEIANLVSCEYFITNILRFDKSITRNYATIDSFVVYMCLEGDFVIEYQNQKTVVNMGNTILIPACIDELILIPDRQALILEVYIEY